MTAHNDFENSDVREGDAGGVIDTIGLGFAVLNRRPYLIWVPVLLDLLIWLGARAVARSPLNVVLDSSGSSWLRERTGDVELMNVASAVVPTLSSQPSIDLDRVRVDERFWEFTGVEGLVFTFVALAVSIIAGSVYLTLIARLVEGAPATSRSFIADCVSTGLRSIGVVAVGAALLLFMMAPVGLVAGGLVFVGVDPVTTIILAALILGGWLGLFLVFAIPAVALGCRELLVALRSSYRVVQHHVLAVVGLLAIALVIRLGTPYALSIFTESTWSVPFAVVVHAYVMTGLLASIMLFFQHRDPERAPVRTGDLPVASS